MVLTPLFPNLWDEALLDLIEKERNTLYAKTGRNKTKIDPEKNNPAVRCKSRASEQLDAFSSIANRCTGQVFPIGENNKRNSEKIRKRRIIRGRNKNTQGCIDTRGGTRSSRADLDNYIYDYDKQTVRRTTPLEHERLNGFEDGWTVLGDSRDTDAKRNFRLGNAVTVDVVEAVGRAIIIGTEIRP
ncbi:MAG: DNA cytosine methyltransferase [Flavobacteriales bacterium]